jgi:hypothetical protein
MTLVTYLHEVHHLPYGRLEKLFREVFGLSTAQGSLVDLVRRSGRALEAEAEAIRQEVVKSEVIGSDETSARVDGKNHWQWVFRTPKASYYVIVPSRSAKVINEVLGESRPKVWVSDLWSAQRKAPAESVSSMLSSIVSINGSPDEGRKSSHSSLVFRRFAHSVRWRACSSSSSVAKDSKRAEMTPLLSITKDHSALGSRHSITVGDRRALERSPCISSGLS